MSVQHLHLRSNSDLVMPPAPLGGMAAAASLYGQHQSTVQGHAQPEEPVFQQQQLQQYQQSQQDWHVQPQQPSSMQHHESYNEPIIAPSASSTPLADERDAEHELSLLQVAIQEAEDRQKSLKEAIAAVNADIAAATKSLNAKRDRATDMQQVCASLQQGHAGLKTVLAEAAQLPSESEGVEKMRARLFLVQSNGHKARQAIQVVFETVALLLSNVIQTPAEQFLQVVQGELDHMREQVPLTAAAAPIAQRLQFVRRKLALKKGSSWQRELRL
jgi:hypothetical protein